MGHYLTDEEANPITSTNRLPVDAQLSGSLMELYGATIADRPLVTAVPVGATFTAVTTQMSWQSDGTNWVVIS